MLSIEPATQFAAVGGFHGDAGDRTPPNNRNNIKDNTLRIVAGVENPGCRAALFRRWSGSSCFSVLA